MKKFVYLLLFIIFPAFTGFVVNAAQQQERDEVRGGIVMQQVQSNDESVLPLAQRDRLDSCGVCCREITETSGMGEPCPQCARSVCVVCEIVSKIKVALARRDEHGNISIDANGRIIPAAIDACPFCRCTARDNHDPDWFYYPLKFELAYLLFTRGFLTHKSSRTRVMLNDVLEHVSRDDIKRFLRQELIEKTPALKRATENARNTLNDFERNNIAPYRQELRDRWNNVRYRVNIGNELRRNDGPTNTVIASPSNVTLLVNHINRLSRAKILMQRDLHQNFKRLFSQEFHRRINAAQQQGHTPSEQRVAHDNS